jgi:tRNA(Ile)-lysidine synthase
MMLDRIANILQQECQLPGKNLLVVGVSGGPDSLCLLHILHHFGYPIIAVHVNHGLRPEANEESEQVMQFAGSLGVEFIARCVDVMKYAQEVSVSIEEAARTLRYGSLFERAKISKASAVVVGHNADDQVETILMHVLRGSGLVGLRGMEFHTVPNPWSEDIPLVRPFLTTWREEIQKYINNYHLSTIFDSSNLDVSFFRNRIRHELLPTLEGYNPCIREVLLRMGQSLKDDYSVLEKLTNEAWESVVIKQDSDYLAFRTDRFVQLPISIQRYLLRRAIAYYLPGLRDVGFDCIERGLLMLVGDKQNSQVDLIAGIRLIKEGKQFWLTINQPYLPAGDLPSITSGEIFVLPISTIFKMNGGWQLEVEEIYDSELLKIRADTNLDPFQAWLDVSGLDLPLIIRVRKPGDQIKPLGLSGHSMKITDLMINLKLPKQARATWPLVCSGNEIVWVPGYRISELARVKPSTSRVIHLRLLRNRTT